MAYGCSHDLSTIIDLHLCLFAFHAQAAKLPDFKGIGQTKTGSSVKPGPTGNVSTSSLPPPRDLRIPVRNINIGGEWQPAGNYGAARDALKPSDAMLRAMVRYFFLVLNTRFRRVMLSLPF